MRKYEIVLIFHPQLEEESRGQLFTRLKGVIGQDHVLDVDEWGTRKLAYEINDLGEGYYMVVNFESTPETVAELDRVCKISDSIIRHMIVRVDE